MGVRLPPFAPAFARLASIPGFGRPARTRVIHGPGRGREVMPGWPRLPSWWWPRVPGETVAIGIADRASRIERGAEEPPRPVTPGRPAAGPAAPELAAARVTAKNARMKTEFIDVSDTTKNLVVEIPSTSSTRRSTRSRATTARPRASPASGPGKVPAKVVRQRFRDQILHDVAHGLIPRAVDEALRERGVEPVDTPDIRDVVVEEGQPLKFTATFDTVPPIDPGDYASITLHAQAGRRSTRRGGRRGARRACASAAARYEPVEGRGDRDAATRCVMDLTRTARGGARPRATPATASRAPTATTNVTVDIGGSANPPGFDEQLIGLARPASARRSTSRTRPTTRSRSWPGRR